MVYITYLVFSFVLEYFTILFVLKKIKLYRRGKIQNFEYFMLFVQYTKYSFPQGRKLFEISNKLLTLTNRQSTSHEVEGKNI